MEESNALGEHFGEHIVRKDERLPSGMWFERESQYITQLDLIGISGEIGPIISVRNIRNWG